MRTLLIIGMFGIVISLAGCVLPVAVESHHDRRYYDDGRDGYPVRMDVVPVVEVGR